MDIETDTMTIHGRKVVKVKQIIEDCKFCCFYENNRNTPTNCKVLNDQYSRGSMDFTAVDIGCVKEIHDTDTREDYVFLDPTNKKNVVAYIAARLEE